MYARYETNRLADHHLSTAYEQVMSIKKQQIKALARFPDDELLSVLPCRRVV